MRGQPEATISLVRIPPPLQPIDVDEAWEKIQGGMTLAEYARESGRAYHAIRAALLRAGLKLPRRERSQRDDIDRRLYTVWTSIRARCLFTRSPLYARFGAQGICIATEWSEFRAFRDWARANGYKPGLALVCGVRSRGFRPSNCRWGTVSEAIRAGLVGSAREAPYEAHRPIDWAKVHRLYVVEGLTISATARRTGASRRGLSDGLRSRSWVRPANPVHGRKNGLSLHRAWTSMRTRCAEFAIARTPGISSKIDPAWLEFDAFYEWASGSGFRKGLCLTRLDRSRAFGPDNCAWMPARESIEHHRPKRATGHPRWLVRAFGETKGTAEWSRDPRCAVSFSGLLVRLRKGWSPEEALRTPPMRSTGREETARVVRAFGRTATLREWGRDPRAKVSHSTILRRIERGLDPETAIQTPAFKTGTIPRKGRGRAR